MLSRYSVSSLRCESMSASPPGPTDDGAKQQPGTFPRGTTEGGSNSNSNRNKPPGGPQQYGSGGGSTPKPIEMQQAELSETEDTSYMYFRQEGLYANSFPKMKEIRRMGKLCDVTLKVDSHSFSAHRIVLASTIPYFYAMFTHNMAESRIKEITMKEIEPL